MAHERTKDKYVKINNIIVILFLIFHLFRRFLDAYQYAIELNNVLYNVLRARAVN
jgi:hypothetical protein